TAGWISAGSSFMGHTPRERPEVLPNRINIDTGAFATGRLTCVVQGFTQLYRRAPADRIAGKAFDGHGRGVARGLSRTLVSAQDPYAHARPERRRSARAYPSSDFGSLAAGICHARRSPCRRGVGACD